MPSLKLVKLSEKDHSIFITVAKQDVSALLQFTYKHVRETAVVADIASDTYLPLEPEPKDTPVYTTPLAVKRLAASMCRMAALKNKKCCSVKDFLSRAAEELKA